jgi:hypothetical protein
MKTLAFALLTAMAAIAVCQAREPQLQEGVLIQAAQQAIAVPIGHLVPCAADWNGDGKKDLILGQFREGAIRLYVNQGTNAAPIFSDFTFLETGGKPIKLDAG